MIKDKNIPIINDGFKPSMGQVSEMLDFLSNLEGQDAEEFYVKAEGALFELVDIWKITQDWEGFQTSKAEKEKAEISKEINPNQLRLNL